jgi:hypothetical protein
VSIYDVVATICTNDMAIEYSSEKGTMASRTHVCGDPVIPSIPSKDRWGENAHFVVAERDANAPQWCPTVDRTSTGIMPLG